MLEQFTVKNYECFKDETTLFAEAINNEDAEHLIKASWSSKMFLPVIAIYGDNGSGKSTLINAIYNLCGRIFDPKIQIQPFTGIGGRSSEDTEFTVFYEEDESLEYKYRLCMNKGSITYECMAVKDRLFGDDTPIVLFERDEEDFMVNDIITLHEYLECIRPDKEETLLNALFQNTDNRYIVNGGCWFLDIIDDKVPNPQTIRAEQINILHKLGSPIADLNDNEVIYSNGQKISREKISKGEAKLIALAYQIAACFHFGGTLFIDDLDAHLHSNTLKAIIRLFSTPSVKTSFSQLVCTLHDTSVMRNTDFRKDALFFTAKSNYGESLIYSLSDFEGYEKVNNLQKDYLDGRFGAVPIFPNDFK